MKTRRQKQTRKGRINRSGNGKEAEYEKTH
jgi:hypothetical protein